jgi:quercetin dioxygenase-like cupin family protein
MNFFDVKELPKKKVKGGILVCSAYLKNVMLTYFEFDQGVRIPTHAHPHEQITLVLEGEMKFVIGENEKILKAGEGATVPSHTEHSVSVLSPAKAIDAWNPVRKDYIVLDEKQK